MSDALEMPTSQCLSTCQDHLSSFNTQLPELTYQLERHITLNDRGACASLWFGIFYAWITLTEINKVLERHPISLDSQVLCTEQIAKVVNLMSAITSDDLQFMRQYYEVCLHHQFCDRLLIGPSTDGVGPWDYYFWQQIGAPSVYRSVLASLATAASRVDI